MKQTIMIFLVGIFLAGCTQMVPTIQDQRTRGSCTDQHYYDTLLVEDHNIPFAWDEDAQMYIAQVPELCLTVKAAVPENEDINEWKPNVEEQAQNSLWVRNNTIFTVDNDIIILNRVVVNNKEPLHNIDETMQNQFDIRAPFLRESKKYCYVEQVSGHRYELQRMVDVLGEEIREGYGLLNSQTCGDDFPMQNVGFEHLIPSLIWYDEQFSNRYLFYKSDQAHDYSLWRNVSFEFYQ